MTKGTCDSAREIDLLKMSDVDIATLAVFTIEICRTKPKCDG